MRKNLNKTQKLTNFHDFLRKYFKKRFSFFNKAFFNQFLVLHYEKFHRLKIPAKSYQTHEQVA